MEPTFLTLAEVVAIHQDQIGRYGGASGVRDWGLLQSAVAVPQAGYGGQHFHSDVYEVAAAYLFHLVQNHAFVDGNKRVEAAAADVLLALNGIRLTADQDSYADLVLAVASGEMANLPSPNFFGRTQNRFECGQYPRR